MRKVSRPYPWRSTGPKMGEFTRFWGQVLADAGWGIRAIGPNTLADGASGR